MADRIHAALNTLNTFEAELEHRFPQAYAEAQALEHSVLDLRSATASEIWPRLWDKPLYANAKIAFADAWHRQLAPFMVDAWKTWGQPEGALLIEKIGHGIQRSSFRLTGPDSERIKNSTRVARHRLYRIQGAAKTLRQRSVASATPFAACYDQSHGERISCLRNEFGEGWGPITVMHFLTDFGLSIKPDLHLVKTCAALGLVEEEAAQKVLDLRTALALNEDIVKMTELKFDVFSPSKLRYLDKLLMEISRSGLLCSHSRTEPNLVGHMLSDLFEVEPEHWEVGGDSYLWRELSGSLGKAPLPASFSAAMQRIERAFRAVTGRDFLLFDDFIMEKYKQDGMPSGLISAGYWRTQAVQHLLLRHSEIARQTQISPA